MKALLRALPAVLALGLSATFIMCTTDSPSRNPIDLGNGGPIGGNPTNIPSLVVTAARFDLNADGADSTTIIANAKNPDGSNLAGAQVLWSLSTRNYTGGTGTLSSALSTTDVNGQATTGYTAPKEDFIPVGALVIVTGTLNIPNNPQGSPKASATILLRPKGVPSSGGTTGPAGTPVPPSVTAVTPSTIKVDAKPPVTVIVQGENFSTTSQVLIVTSDGLTTIKPTFLSTTQLRFTVPTTTKPGSGSLFVTGPLNTLSTATGITLTSGVVTCEDCPDTVIPVITSILPAQGPVTQTTRVILLGSGFNVLTCPSASNITLINEFLGLRKICPVNGEPATAQRLVIDIPSVSSNQSGPVNIFVTNDDGSISNTVVFTYTTTIANAPQISAISPSSGPTTGETRAIITGANFSSSDAVVIAAPNVFSPPTDLCSDGQPFCSNNQCVLSQARGLCTINGTPGQDPFVFRGSGQLEIITPNVGTNAAGPADVLVRTAGATTSNIFTFNFTSPANLAPPRITSLSSTSLSGDNCCPQGSYQLIIFGQNFRKCFSVIVANGPSGIHEILPTPDVSDCNVRRGSTSTESPRERLFRILPPDGETMDCRSRPDLVALRQTGPTQYLHDQICYTPSTVPVAFSPYIANMIGAPGDASDVTSGGAVEWINETSIRLIFGPNDTPGCASSDTASIYVSNDPGRGLSGDLTSNVITWTANNTADCLPTLAAPAISSIAPSIAACGGGQSVTIFGSSLAVNGNPTVFVGNVPATVTSASATMVTITVPPAPVPACSTFSGAAAPFACTQLINLTTSLGSTSTTFSYNSNSMTSCCALKATGTTCALGSECCSGVCVPGAPALCN